MLHRKPSTACTAPRSPTWDHLPVDILILILSQCRIDELLLLRLTSSRTRNTIDEYIATIAPAVARATFPSSTILLTPPPRYTFSWLKDLIPQHLAAILVDQHRSSHDYAPNRYGIPAEDPFGNPMRSHVANGWRVFQRLWSISHAVYQLSSKEVLASSKDLAWRFVNPTRFRFAVFKQREDLILSRRLEYIKTLSPAQAKDYKLMFLLLSAVFRTGVSNIGDAYKPWIFDWSCGIDGQRLLRLGESWLTHFVLAEGPGLFWKQWWSLAPGEAETKNWIRDRAIEAWLGESKVSADDFVRDFQPGEWVDVNAKWHDVQRDHAAQVQRAVEERTMMSRPHRASSASMFYFIKYAEHRQERDSKGIAPPRESLFGVPFHVEFRCPDEMARKASAVREERAGGVGVVALPRRER